MGAAGAVDLRVGGLPLGVACTCEKKKMLDAGAILNSGINLVVSVLGIFQQIF